MFYLAPPKSEKELAHYITWLSKTGNSTVVLKKVDDLSGALILAGGADVGINKNRDEFELRLIDKAIKNGWPILGICRGMQLVNVYFNGIVEDLLIEENHCQSASDLVASKFEDKESIFHSVSSLTEGFSVNSRHHQHCATVNYPLKPIVWSEDGIVEAITGPNILLVQWHPERREIADTYASDWPLQWIMTKEIKS